VVEDDAAADVSSVEQEEVTEETTKQPDDAQIERDKSESLPG